MEALVCRLARENTCGYQRICGELRKLGIKLSKSCIADILRRNNLPPSPERKGLTWRGFLARHADVLLCADLFTKEIWTFCGLRRAYVERGAPVRLAPPVTTRSASPRYFDAPMILPRPQRIGLSDSR